MLEGPLWIGTMNAYYPSRFSRRRRQPETVHSRSGPRASDNI